MTLSGKAYHCSAGETFDSVALAVYGDEKYAADLLCANPTLCRVPVFQGGEMVILPVVYVPGDQYAPDKMPDVAPWKEA